MPFRQTIGISLALLMASAGALAKTQETRASYHPAQPATAEPGKSPNRSGKARVAHRRHQPRSWHRLVSHRAARHRHWADTAAAADGGLAEPQWGPMHATEAMQIGQAAWYNLVGFRTSNGERLDRVTLTAAHRSLPARLVRQGNQPRHRAFGDRQDQRPRPVQPPLHHRLVAACGTSPRHVACRCRRRRRRAGRRGRCRGADRCRLSRSRGVIATQ